MRVLLDIGHKYQNDIRNKGILYKGVYEADLVEEYYHKLQEKIIQSGEEIVTIKTDKNILNCSYEDRIKWANNNNIDLYISGHIKFNSNESDIVYCGGKKNFKIANLLKNIINQDKYIAVGKVVDIIKLSKNYDDYVPLDKLKCQNILFRPAFIDENKNGLLIIDKFFSDVVNILFEFITKIREEKYERN